MERLIFPITKKEAEKQGVKYSSKKNKEALFPSQLRELREKKGISQATLARDLGVSKSTIGLYETGDTLPDAKTLHDLAVYFGVSADYLIGLSNVQSSNPSFRKICEITGLSEKACNNLMDIKHQIENDECHSLHRDANNVINFLLESEDLYDAIKLLSSMIQYMKDCKAADDKRFEFLLENPEECKKMDIKVENAIRELQECSFGHYLAVSRNQFAINMEAAAKRKISKVIENLYNMYDINRTLVEVDGAEE